jgi:hypothetical protein
MTGSGLPMRFADLDGTMIEVYQLPTHLVNESGMGFPSAIEAQLDRALGPKATMAHSGPTTTSLTISTGS